MKIEKKTKKKSEIAPTMPRTAYNYYVKDWWSKVKAINNWDKVKLIAQEWKVMKVEEKKKYKEMQRKDRERYNQEFKKMSLEAVKNPLWVAKKAPHISKKLKIKRPQNAFMLYYKDKISLVKA